MPGARNELKIERASPGSSRLAREALGKSIDFSRVQHLLQLDGDSEAPRFVEAQQPLEDGKSYQASDGSLYYRPLLRVANRKGGIPGPDVLFSKTADGRVLLHFVLEEQPPGGMPAQAKALPVRVEDARLIHGDQQLVFGQPLMVLNDAEDAVAPGFTILGGGEIPPDKVDAVYNAMTTQTSGARLRLNMAFSYWLEQGGTRLVDPRIKQPLVKVPASKVTATVIGRLKLSSLADASDSTAAPAPLAVKYARPDLVAEKFRSRASVEEILGRDLERKAQPGFKTITLVREIPFVFSPDLAANVAIYRAIAATEILPEAWADSPFGPISKAPFPNTVYRLPDELRLAYNEDLGLPHMIPTLYRDEDGEPRVRVVLRAVPWHDPEQLVGLRDWLQQGSGGAYAHPDVVIGGYKEAKLYLTTMFPESIKVLGEDGVSISLEEGVDLTLDLTLEFYKFLCELLTRSVGVTGDVAITIEAKSPVEGEPPETRTWRRPMRLRLSDLASLPARVRVPNDCLSPRRVYVENRGPATIRVGGCAPRLLQVDSNSVVPLGVFEAVTSTAFPVEVDPRSEAPIDVGPGLGSESTVWNAVHLELLDQELARAPEEVLDKIHQVMPEGTVPWKISAECPVFLQETVPAKFENLYQVEVQVLREGYAAQQIMLGRGSKASVQVTMHRTLRDVLASDAGAVQTFRYRVRNVYFDHMGSWGEEQTGEGSHLIVFPRPVEDD